MSVLFAVMRYFNSRPHEEVDFVYVCLILDVVTFQLTTSRGGRLVYVCLILDVVTFQLTTSRGGRLCADSSPYHRHGISTHDLTRRSTYNWFVSSNLFIYFNSRPHEEVDLVYNIVQKLVHISNFNSRPHEEVDVLPAERSPNTIYFNSRPHEEVDILFTT